MEFEELYVSKGCVRSLRGTATIIQGRVVGLFAFGSNQRNEYKQIIHIIQSTFHLKKLNLMYIWCNLAVVLPSWTSWNLQEKNSATFGTLDGCQEVFLMRDYWCFAVCWFEWMQNYLLYYMSMCMFYVHVFNVHIHHIASFFSQSTHSIAGPGGVATTRDSRWVALLQIGLILVSYPNDGGHWSFLVTVLPHEWNEVWSKESSLGWSM